MRLGPYELLEIVGRGGMSTVHRGRHVPSGETVAVKVMARERAADRVLLQRFEQEFAVARSLSHPHIVRGLDFGVCSGVPYLVMEFVEGQNLGQRVRQLGPLPAVEAVRVNLEISAALQLAHANKLIHRDVKPENILVGTDGQARLTDLGLIKDLDGAADLTRSRAFMGTASYMAPEQFRDARHADVRSDLYGLASTLFYSLTGTPPFVGRGNVAILRKKLNNDFTPLRQLLPAAPAALERAIHAALDVSPARRPASCTAWIAALREAAEQLPADTLHAPARPASTASGAERRGARRYPLAMGATCRPVPGRADPWTAEILDISLTGVRLQMRRRFEVGAVLAVQVLDAPAGGMASLLVRARWVQATADEQWRVGCAFHYPLSEDELNRLVECRTATVVVQPEATA
jgi:serine/threonine protein kinase